MGRSGGSKANPTLTATRFPPAAAPAESADAHLAAEEAITALEAAGQGLDKVARLQFALGRSARLLRENASGGLTPTQLAVLGALLRAGPRQLTELAAAERINPTLLSRVVGRLEEDGLVHRSAQEQDRRAYLVSITDKGRSLAEGLRHERCSDLAQHLASLDPVQVSALFDALPGLEALAEQLMQDRKG
jgi:DNA-binding MarR family transcriptional regulator